MCTEPRAAQSGAGLLPEFYVVADYEPDAEAEAPRDAAALRASQLLETYLEGLDPAVSPEAAISKSDGAESWEAEQYEQVGWVAFYGALHPARFAPPSSHLCRRAGERAWRVERAPPVLETSPALSATVHSVCTLV